MKKRNVILHTILPLVGMVLLAVVVVLLTAAIRHAVWEAPYGPVTGLPAIHTVAPMDVQIPDAADETAAVLAVEGCYDANNNLVAYRVETSVVGYNVKSPIRMAVTVSSDGQALRNIEILSQKETEYYGARIKEASFAERFSDVRLPIFLKGQSGRGTMVDGISGATVSSKAVVKGIHTAEEFVKTQLVQGE